MEMLDLSFAAQSSALGAHRPTSTLGKVVCRISSALARCDGSAEMARIAKKIAEMVRIIFSPRGPTHSAGIDIVALQKEHAHEIALADDLTERTKGKKRNQDQQHDDTSRNQLIERAAAEIGKRVRDAAMVDVADHDLFQNVENDQQHEKHERPVQRRPNERQRLETLAKVERSSDQHKFGADQGLHRGESKRRKRDALRLENGGFQICERAKADVEIERNDDKFPQFCGGSFAD